MRQDVAEKKVRGLQKEFLTRIEEHPAFGVMPPADFNMLRKRVFRGTFSAFRLGVVGLDRTTEHLGTLFAGCLVGLNTKLDPQLYSEVAEMCLRCSLDAFRLGAMVSAAKDL